MSGCRARGPGPAGPGDVVPQRGQRGSGEALRGAGLLSPEHPAACLEAVGAFQRVSNGAKPQPRSSWHPRGSQSWRLHCGNGREAGRPRGCEEELGLRAEGAAPPGHAAAFVLSHRDSAVRSLQARGARTE